MLSQDVRVSVCLFATRLYCVDAATAKHIVKPFPPSGSHTVLVSVLWQYSGWDPVTGASNSKGYEKLAFFYKYLALFWK